MNIFCQLGVHTWDTELAHWIHGESGARYLKGHYRHCASCNQWQEYIPFDDGGGKWVATKKPNATLEPRWTNQTKV